MPCIGLHTTQWFYTLHLRYKPDITTIKKHCKVETLFIKPVHHDLCKLAIPCQLIIIVWQRDWILFMCLCEEVTMALKINEYRGGHLKPADVYICIRCWWPVSPRQPTVATAANENLRAFYLWVAPPSSTWATMIPWGERLDPRPPVIWIPSPSWPFTMCIFQIRLPSRGCGTEKKNICLDNQECDCIKLRQFYLAPVLWFYIALQLLNYFWLSWIKVKNMHVLVLFWAHTSEEKL